MKALKKIVLFTFIGLVFVTCKKEVLTPSSTVGQPVFSFNGTINGSSLNLQAGVNNYYMYSTFKQDSAGVYSFIGTLENSNGIPYNSIQITINDYRISGSNASVAGHIDSSFSQSLYTYNIPGGIRDTTYSITFTPIIYAGGSAGSYTYSFGDLTATTINSSNSPIIHTYKNSGTYPTALTVQFSSGSVTMRDTITILKSQPQLWMDPIRSKIISSYLHGARIAFKDTILNGGAPYTFLWNFGDNTHVLYSPYSEDTMTVSHTYSDSGIHQVHSIYLKVTDISGHSVSHNYQVWDTNNTYPGGLIDYKMSVPAPSIVTNTFALSNVTVNYTDQNGHQYTSSNILQPTSSTFHITSLSGYQKNMYNQQTEMVTVTFNCMLYNSTLAPNGIPASGTAVIAVAYQ